MSDAASNSQDITQMLRAWSEGQREALDELLPLVYEELHRQAARYLRYERPDHTLQTTALIHEAYIKLIDQRDGAREIFGRSLRGRCSHAAGSIGTARFA